MRAAPGLVFAMPAEARALVGPFGWVRAGGLSVRRGSLPDGTGLLCARSGVGAERAASAARWLAAEGATALVAMGISGGLDPGLRAGDLVVADAVLRVGGEGDGRWAADADRAGDVCRILSAEGLRVARGAVACADRVVASPADKAALHAGSGALAVDMESAGVARAASERNLPLVVLRAVSDPADRALPDAVLRCFDGGGNIRPSAVLRMAAGRPSLVCDLVRLERGFSAALASLRRAWRALVRAGFPERLVPA